MNWTQVNIYTTTQGIEPVAFELLSLGITGYTVTDSNDFKEFLENKNGQWDYIDDDLMGLSDCETYITAYIPENEQGAETLKMLIANIAQLKMRDENAQFGRLEIELDGVKEEDWANNWKQYFKPFCVGKKLYVKPSWEEAVGAENRRILEIDPASSFGTGQHHTTRLCLEMLDDCVCGGESVLDLGCGSGILSIGAILLGAKNAVAVDIMQNAAETAAENAGKNGISSDIYKTYCGDVLSCNDLCDIIGTNYDIICANIVSDILIAMAPLFVKFIKSGGTLIVSGIITERADEVDAVMKQNGFIQTQFADSNGWAAIKYTIN